MLDRCDEVLTHPMPFPLGRYRSILVLAPHPDDEIYGCGGLLALAKEAGIGACALLLTDGDAQAGDGSDPLARIGESLAAARLLGHQIECAHLADRKLRLEPALVNAVAAAMERHQPDLVLAPAPGEPHPDHQAVALAALAALTRTPRILADLAWYESGGGLTHVTHLLDLTGQYHRKREAMACFASQETHHPYARRMESRDSFRAFTLGPQATHAEAFQLLPLRERGYPAAMAGLDALFLHARGQAAHPAELPLVSIMIRSIGSPLLEQAVASALAQTYRPIEIVLVAAHARDLYQRHPQWQCQPLIRQVLPAEPLNRPRAANAALDAARGDYCLFLDEDDLIAPGHLARLVAAIEERPGARAAYAGVEAVDAGGAWIGIFDEPFDAARLMEENFIPIHAALFDRTLVEKGCRFDESLDVYEDWDFWLRLSRLTGFKHVAGASATYRMGGGSAVGLAPAAERQGEGRRRIYEKWRMRFDADDYDALYLYHKKTREAARERMLEMEAQVADLRRQLARQLADSGQQLADVGQQLAEARQAREDIMASTSWRMTAPLRKAARILKRLLASRL